jgi:hypothetical protein
MFGFGENKLHFEGKKFRDLFEAIDAKHDRKDDGFRYIYTSGATEYRGFAVKPRPELATFIRERMLQILNDSVYFVCTFRDDGTVLISAQYNSIIGSRWLTITTADDIPSKNKVAATKIVATAPTTGDKDA